MKLSFFWASVAEITRETWAIEQNCVSVCVCTRAAIEDTINFWVSQRYILIHVFIHGRILTFVIYITHKLFPIPPPKHIVNQRNHPNHHLQPKNNTKPPSLFLNAQPFQHLNPLYTQTQKPETEKKWVSLFGPLSLSTFMTSRERRSKKN